MLTKAPVLSQSVSGPLLETSHVGLSGIGVILSDLISVQDSILNTMRTDCVKLYGDKTQICNTYSGLKKYWEDRMRRPSKA